MKLVVCTATWNRPKMLGRLIACFEQQTYANRELIVLDDGGQYPDQPSGYRWRVFSHNNRYATLGGKRHALATMAKEMYDADVIMMWDDDDMFLPHALDAIANAYAKPHKWTQSRESYEWDGNVIRRIETFHRSDPFSMAYHGCWSYRMDAYMKVGGYDDRQDEDNPMAIKMTNAFGYSGDTLCREYPEPYLIYSQESDAEHLSHSYHKIGFEATWDKFGQQHLEPAKIEVGFDRDYFALPRPKVAEARQW